MAIPDGVQERVADLLCQTAALDPQSVVLEIGVGTGRIALPLAARVNRVLAAILSRYGSLDAELDLDREFCVRTFAVAEL